MFDIEHPFFVESYLSYVEACRTLHIFFLCVCAENRLRIFSPLARCSGSYLILLFHLRSTATNLIMALNYQGRLTVCYLINDFSDIVY